MATVAEMGEVEELHSKEEGTVVNGDASDVEMEADECDDTSIKKMHDSTKESILESMDVDDKIDEKVVEDTETKEEENHEDGHESEGEDDVEDKSESIVEESDVKETEIESEKEGDEEPEIIKSSVKTDIVTDENDKLDEVHEIEDDDDVIHVEAKENGIDKEINETIELNDSGGEDGEIDGDVMIVESVVPKENGTNDQTKSDMSDVIELDSTPIKKNPRDDDDDEDSDDGESLTPRRSTRNLNKQKSYVESDKEEDEEAATTQSSEESDIEEILPEDPLANIGDAIHIEKIPAKKKIIPTQISSSTIVVKDTKRLVEIASKSNSSNTTGKKEPTLVIIDTNSILSGRGPIPIKKTSPPPMTKPPQASQMPPSYSNMLPMALPAQGIYPPNMRATITPIPVNTPPKPAPPIVPPTPVLPTLTDDMFVVEAPSFIVPYVYEKPPVKDLKGFVDDYRKKIETLKKLLEDKIKEQEDQQKKDEKDKNDEKEGIDDKTKDEEKMEVDNDKSKDKTKEETEDQPPVVPLPTLKVQQEDPSKMYSYFGSPLGKFFIDIGIGLVQEFVQTDLLKQQKRKRERERGKNPETHKTIQSLVKNLEFSKENNGPYKLEMKKCEFCSYKSDSALAMSYHLETPHVKNYVYKCNFCPYEIRSPHDILFHMEAEHMVRGRLERALSFHQCPNCPFEDNQKSKLSRHLIACARKFKPDRNLEPPIDWEPPAKIPRVPKMRQGLNASAYQAMSKSSQFQFLSKMQLQSNNALNRGRGRPTVGPNMKPTPIGRPSGMVYKQAMSGGSVLLPTNYQISGNQVFQVVGGQELSGRLGPAGHMTFVPNIPASTSSIMQQTPSKAKPVNTPSISITPLPRASSSTSTGPSPTQTAKPGDTNSKNTFVICEICDGYIKDLEQLRNHMQWIHKVKIHPKMIYNRPPLNCQKCQFRFFTDQGLERHLLGSHGLVTSSMQDAANRSKDAGRCPVCGRVYQWKLLNHVARDHNMTLKPAHLSYKCTVCTATFGMYKQFENHVYSAHSVVAKRVMDKKGPSAASTPNKTNDQSPKPLKINDEITIIPQPAKSNSGGAGTSKEGSPAPAASNSARNSTPSTSKMKQLKNILTSSSRIPCHSKRW